MLEFVLAHWNNNTQLDQSWHFLHNAEFLEEKEQIPILFIVIFCLTWPVMISHSS